MNRETMEEAFLNDAQEVARLGERLEQNAAERRELIDRARMIYEQASKTREIASRLIEERGGSNVSEPMKGY